MKHDIFPHANTIVCIEDSKMLKRFQYELLYGADGLQAVLDELNNMNYFHLHRNADIINYRTMLDGLMKATMNLIKEIAPNEMIWRIFALNYDIHNIKLVVKERTMERRLDSLALDFGSYTMPTLRSAAVKESDDILKNECLTRGLFEALRAKDIYDVDFILDRTYFHALRIFADELGSTGIIEFVVERIDLFNISVLAQSLVIGSPEEYFARAFSEHGSLPLKEWQQYIEGGIENLGNFVLWEKYRPVLGEAYSREKRLSEFDVLVDNYLIGLTKACKLMAFGIEPICAYFYNKLMEIKNIRILLSGKENGYAIGEIKKRMRIPYEL